MEENNKNVGENDIQQQSEASNPDDIDKIKKERDEYLDGWKRAKAEFINYKKDELKRVEIIVKFSNETIIKDLISVLDSFDLAVESLGGESKIEKGVYLIRAQLEDIMRKYGLERIMVSVGMQFDPSLHEAIASVDSNEKSGTVTEEVEKGYMLNGKLIRAARVKVAR